MLYTIHFDVAALVINLVVLGHFSYKKTINTNQTRLFHMFLRASIFSTTASIIASTVADVTYEFPMVVDYSVAFLYFFILNWEFLLFYRYLLTAVKGRIHYTSKEKINLFLPTVVNFMFLFTNNFTHFLFSFDSNGVYHNGPLFLIVYALPMLYLGMSLWYTFKYTEKVTPMLRYSVYFFTFGTIVASIIQFLIPTLMVVEFVTATSVLLIYLSLENPEHYEDMELGTYNRMAFVETLGVKFEKGEHFELLVVKVTGLEYLNETFGVLCETALLKQVTKYLSAINKDLQLFAIKRNQFVLVGRLKKSVWIEILDNIRNRFKYSFVYNEAEIMLTPLFCMVSYPNSVENLEDTLNIIDYSILEAKKQGSEKTIYISADKLSEGKREVEVLNAIKNAIKENRFEVYYQPIYSANAKSYTGAEALIRLIDDKLGFISPDEFIPLAEQNGIILEIGEIVFRKVCEFMSQVKIWEKGIQYVDVNLSVIQCMQEKLHEVLLNIMDEYGIEYHYITLEVTETVASIGGNAIMTNMQALIDKGMHISLDDYGTGFSNTAMLVEYPFSTIKLDKSVLWKAMDNEKAMSALKYMIAMITDMHMTVICEGVETEEQAKLLVEAGCECHQGYYYSKPLKQDMFLNAIQK